MTLTSPVRALITARSIAVLAGGLALAAAYLWHNINRRRVANCSRERDKMKEGDKLLLQSILAEAKAAKTTMVENNEDNDDDGLNNVNTSNSSNEMQQRDEGNDRALTMQQLQGLIDKPNEGDGCCTEDDYDNAMYQQQTNLDSAQPLLNEQERQDLDHHQQQQPMVDNNMCSESCNTSSIGYNLADSPSNQSEGSQDSGRATGGLASSMSPIENNLPDDWHVYEFEVPHSLVGLVIGIQGKTIRELSQRAEVRMTIRAHHVPIKLKTHQICTVEGARDNINKCLRMLRRRFPPERFPELNLRPVIPPNINFPPVDFYCMQPDAVNFQNNLKLVTLQEGCANPVAVSCINETGLIDLQLITHPSYHALKQLDLYMSNIYNMNIDIPEVPQGDDKICCAAPAAGGWYRAITCAYYPASDEVTVRFVDYGGISRIARADLRQIRSDFMSLPLQAVECRLAHVEPADGVTKWSVDALEKLNSLVSTCCIEAVVVGYFESGMPAVELSITNAENQVIRVDEVLLEEGLVQKSDTSKLLEAMPMRPSSNYGCGNDRVTESLSSETITMSN